MNCSRLAVLFTPAFIHKQSFQYVHEKKQCRKLYEDVEVWGPLRLVFSNTCHVW